MHLLLVSCVKMEAHRPIPAHPLILCGPPVKVCVNLFLKNLSFHPSRGIIEPVNKCKRLSLSEFYKNFLLPVSPGRPTCCWTGALRRFHRWGRWVTGWMECGLCPARRPSLELVTAPVTRWPKPPQSKDTKPADTQIRSLFAGLSTLGKAREFEEALGEEHTHTHTLMLIEKVKEAIEPWLKVSRWESC